MSSMYSRTTEQYIQSCQSQWCRGLYCVASDYIVLIMLQAFFPMYKDTYIASRSSCVTDMHELLKVEYIGDETFTATPLG